MTPDDASFASYAATDPLDRLDRHVGDRIRLRRTTLGVSQSELGEQLGVSFQQVQKYERGATRVSASRLWDIARALDVNIAYFFDQIGREVAPPQILLNREGHELVEAFRRIRSAHRRALLLNLIAELAQADAQSAS